MLATLLLLSSVLFGIFERDIWIRTQRAAIASRRATNLATHLAQYFFIALAFFMLDVSKEDDRSPRAANPLLSKHNYTPIVISRNNKNKHLTIIKPT